MITAKNKPVVVLLEDSEVRATWLAKLGQTLGFAVWWTRNVQDFHQFVHDGLTSDRLFLVIMDHDLGHKDGKDGFGEDGSDAAQDMDDIGNTPIILWSHNRPAVLRMMGLLRDNKTEGPVRQITFTETNQKSLSGVVHATLLQFRHRNSDKQRWN